ncbi:TonB-dependent receptor [Sphingomonas prati]|uniref:Iron complex outermembrane receptor protein n=1 Tax=Sphingomonas prati TaxID=1843237 RepID=A0A7W9BPQ6_9SPHN|nr:TonB-dependent receptor [Sphingomonas prati]MBB5727815.1 iron complex outermembrane receptor protein [Sphingomonas prati]GGE80922.1 TonB-dependent receptor [Sphingomonas prati]
MKKFLIGCAVSALATSGAYAQSTGSVDFDADAIVVTGARTTDVGGFVSPEGSKSRGVLTSEFIQRQTPGQSINDVINYLPGVNFQNNDPFGSAGGTLNIRGFDSSRISQTFDGIPLNDSGNYAIYSSQQLDPELIEQVNVNYGSTDVDSPTAGASGSTVNYRTRNPSETLGGQIVASLGDFDFHRVFGVLDTGVFTPFGTRAFFSGSTSINDAVYGNKGQIKKQQYNVKVYQPIGTEGDFISVAGHYSQSRNGFFGSVPLRTDTTGGRVVGSGSTNRFPLTRDERDFTIPDCTVAAARPGVVDTANTCGSLYEERFNPSNTGNIRVNSKFTLADGLVLTVDPSFQSVKANGGGTVVAQEGFRDIDPSAAGVYNASGYLAGVPYFGGVDLNGDGDTIDGVRVLAPSQTRTKRYGVIAGLRYDFSDTQTVRASYTLDHARHRQTGETGLLGVNGIPNDVFPVNDPLTSKTGDILQKRDRLSYAILNQASGEYRGTFLNDILTVNAGVRLPFFKRDLTNNCFTSSAGGFVECYGSNTVDAAAYDSLVPSASSPQQRVLKYDKVLPSGGITVAITPQATLFGSYSKGLQVPGTDNLYNSFYFAEGTAQASPVPEQTDNFDLGGRFRSSKIQAQISGWFTRFENRLASAYDAELDQTVYRNLGRVDKYGVDGSIAYTPIPEATLYVMGSYLQSEIKNDVVIGECTAVSATTGCTAIGQTIYANTKGKRESGASVYSFGGRAQGNFGPLTVGVQAKRTGPRYVNDQNIAISANSVTSLNSNAGAILYSAKTPAYTLVDLDIRFSLAQFGLAKSFFQLNVTNLFDKLYVGGFNGGSLLSTAIPNVQIGAPRAVVGSFSVGF